MLIDLQKDYKPCLSGDRENKAIFIYTESAIVLIDKFSSLFKDYRLKLNKKKKKK